MISTQENDQETHEVEKSWRFFTNLLFHEIQFSFSFLVARHRDPIDAQKVGQAVD